MKFEAIEAMFSAKVAEYLGKGYVINALTMSGHQGEIAKIDLRKGGEIIRVMLDKAHNWRSWYHDGVALVVGRSPKLPHDEYDRIWNSELEVIERVEWVKLTNYKRGNEWYVTAEEAAAAERVKNARMAERWRTGGGCQLYLGDKAAQIVLPFVKRQRGCKSCKPSDIKVYKSGRGGVGKYFVEAKGKEFRLK